MGTIHQQVQNLNYLEVNNALNSCYSGNAIQAALFGEISQEVRNENRSVSNAEIAELAATFSRAYAGGTPVLFTGVDINRGNVGEFCAASAGRAEELGVLNGFLAEKLELRSSDPVTVYEAADGMIRSVLRDQTVGETIAKVPAPHSIHAGGRTRYLNENEAHLIAAAVAYKEADGSVRYSQEQNSQAGYYANQSYDNIPNVKMQNAIQAGLIQGGEAFNINHGLASQGLNEGFEPQKASHGR